MSVCRICWAHVNSTKHATLLCRVGLVLPKWPSRYTVVPYLFSITIPDHDLPYPALPYPALVCIGLAVSFCVQSRTGVQFSSRGWVLYLLGILELAVSVASRPGDVQKYPTSTKPISRIQALWAKCHISIECLIR